jgi:hypothetical protein
MLHDHRDLATAVAHHLRDNALEFAAWRDVIALLPPLRYQGPGDLLMFEEYLGQMGLILIRDPRENVVQVAKEFQ